MINEYRDAIKHSNFFSFLSSDYRNAKNFYITISKDGIFEKENAIKNLNEYLKYIPLYEELQKVKKEIK